MLGGSTDKPTTAFLGLSQLIQGRPLVPCASTGKFQGSRTEVAVLV